MEILTGLFYSLLLVGWVIDGVLCQTYWNEGWQNKTAMEEFRARVRRERVLTYALDHTMTNATEGALPLSLTLTSLADAVSHSSCVQFKQKEDLTTNPGYKLADLVLTYKADWKECLLEFRDLPYTTNQRSCTDKEWWVDRLLLDYLGINPIFRYPLYKARGEIRLWFMEISNLNQLLECPCQDDLEDCELEKSCETNGRQIGKCRATCGVCPYYDYHQ